VPSRDPAWLCYLARVYEPSAGVQAAYNVASQKLVIDFAEELQAIVKVLLSEDMCDSPTAFGDQWHCRSA
jgi:hypothetical protein